MAENEPTINEEVVEPPEVTPEVTPEPEAPEVPELPEPEPTPEPEPEPEEQPQSRREALRIAKLVARQVQQQQQQPTVTPMDYSEVLNAEPEVIAQLEADRKAVVQAEQSQAVRQAESLRFQTRLEIDAPKVESKYPQLNKESDQFDPVIADALNSHYLNLVGFDPRTGAVQNANLRYADFIEAQYELAGALANDQVAKTSRNIAKQAATTGLRPDGSRAKRLDLNKDPEMMSDEELEARIAQAVPKK